MSHEVVHADMEGFADRLIVALNKELVIQPAGESGLHAEISRKTWRGAACEHCSPYTDAQWTPEQRKILLLETMNRWQAAHNKVLAALSAELEKIDDEKKGS